MSMVEATVKSKAKKKIRGIIIGLLTFILPYMVIVVLLGDMVDTVSGFFSAIGDFFTGGEVPEEYEECFKELNISRRNFNKILKFENKSADLRKFDYTVTFTDYVTTYGPNKIPNGTMPVQRYAYGTLCGESLTRPYRIKWQNVYAMSFLTEIIRNNKGKDFEEIDFDEAFNSKKKIKKSTINKVEAALGKNRYEYVYDYFNDSSHEYSSQSFVGTGMTYTGTSVASYQEGRSCSYNVPILVLSEVHTWYCDYTIDQNSGKVTKAYNLQRCQETLQEMGWKKSFLPLYVFLLQRLPDMDSERNDLIQLCKLLGVNSNVTGRLDITATDAFDGSDSEFLPSGTSTGSIIESYTPVVYFNQRDYLDIPFGQSTYTTIYKAGCGPTSLACVISTLTSYKVDPISMCDWAYKNHYLFEGIDSDGNKYGASRHELIMDGLNTYGLKCKAYHLKNNKSSRKKVREALGNGQLAIILMGPGPSKFTSSGHFMVLHGYDASTDEIAVADVANRLKCHNWPASTIFNESKLYADNNVWIVENP